MHGEDHGEIVDARKGAYMTEESKLPEQTIAFRRYVHQLLDTDLKYVYDAEDVRPELILLLQIIRQLKINRF